MTDILWFVLILAILFLPWKSIWDKLRGKEEEEMIPEDAIEFETLFQAKIRCLELAVSGGSRPATEVIADAQLFWAFLLKADPESTDE